VLKNPYLKCIFIVNVLGMFCERSFGESRTIWHGLQFKPGLPTCFFQIYNSSINYQIHSYILICLLYIYIGLKVSKALACALKLLEQQKSLNPLSNVRWHSSLIKSAHTTLNISGLFGEQPGSWDCWKTRSVWTSDRMSWMLFEGPV